MEKSKIYGIVGTTLFSIVVLLILFLVVMPSVDRPQDDFGVMVSFGTDMDGEGVEKMFASVPKPTTSSPATSAEKVEDILTQNTEDTPVITPEKEQKKKPKTDIETPRPKENPTPKNQIDKTQEEQAKKTSNLVDNAFSQSFGSSGKSKGTGRQGNPAGRGNSNGHSWTLSGRGLVGGIISPNYTSNVEGKITVAIRVDETGQVVGASISSPTTISEKKTRDAAIQAAKRTKFSKGKGISVGTITYHFKLQ